MNQVINLRNSVKVKGCAPTILINSLIKGFFFKVQKMISSYQTKHPDLEF